MLLLFTSSRSLSRKGIYVGDIIICWHKNVNLDERERRRVESCEQLEKDWILELFEYSVVKKGGSVTVALNSAYHCSKVGSTKTTSLILQVLEQGWHRKRKARSAVGDKPCPWTVNKVVPCSSCQQAASKGEGVRLRLSEPFIRCFRSMSQNSWRWILTRAWPANGQILTLSPITKATTRRFPKNLCHVKKNKDQCYVTLPGWK